jgi:hypothetical protein
MDDSSPDRSLLELGWKVNSGMGPAYWLGWRPRVGKHNARDLVRVPAEAAGRHTAIMAAPGSGKSYFLGRLVEELVLHTKARFVILDPNSDFRRFHEIEGTKLWQGVKYDRQKRLGKLPTESSREEFADRWPVEEIRIVTANPPNRDSGGGYDEFSLPWASLSIELLAEEIAPEVRSDLRHCHAFVRIVAQLLGLVVLLAPEREHDYNVITQAERLLVEAGRLGETSFRRFVRDEYRLDEVLVPSRLKKLAAKHQETMAALVPRQFQDTRFSLVASLLAEENAAALKLREHMERQLSGLVWAAAYASPVSHYYFSRAREYEAAGLLDASIDPHTMDSGALGSNRITILDLSSLKTSTQRLLAVNSGLNDQLERAWLTHNAALHLADKEEDNRVPTFIVVDEAHELLPADPQGPAESAVRDQFRTIIAEGRKYALFLILASQRPDVLDPLIVSGCENVALMKLSTPTILERTRSLLGLEYIRSELERCLLFDKGRVLLAGPWSGASPQFCYVAARRTVEGGADLQSDWATPP